MSLSSAIYNANLPNCYINIEEFKPGMSALNIYNSKGQLIGIMKRSGKTWTYHVARGVQLQLKVSTNQLEEWTKDIIFFMRTIYSKREIDI